MSARSRAAGLAAAVLVSVLLLAFVPVVGVPLALLLVIAAVIRFPGAVVALSWTGFWLYLGALDLLGVHTRTVYTVGAYGAVAIGLGLFVWSRRDVLRRRAASAPRGTRIWAAVAALLAAAFVIGAAVVGDGPLAHRLLGVFLISTIPAAIAAASMTRRDLEEARAALVVIGLGFVAVNLIAARHGAPPVGRFSPIASLDPITASLVSTIGCVAALTYRPRSRLGVVLQAVVASVLAAGAMINGSRGPVVALIGVVILALVLHRRAAMFVVGLAVVVGIAVGSKLEVNLIGQPPALSSLAHETRHPARPEQPSVTSVPISSLHIRREWFMSALRQIPDKPIVGHGVGMLVDDTPEATAMDIKGTLVYPHNDVIEAFYSLGVVGGLLFVAFAALPIAILWQHRRRNEEPEMLFATLLFAFAFLQGNFSGEIGTDVILWSTAAFAVVALGDRNRARS
ncbi:MAG: O-antigen ligase family protein [Gaiellaceae bacterium]